MDVILLEKIGKLGDIGDQVVVKAGFGRNYLIPQNKALAATAQNITEFEARRAELQATMARGKADAEIRAAKLADLTITITANAGEEGKLFGSVGARDLANAITDAGVEVSKSEVRLAEGTLRELGDHTVDIELHADVVQSVNVTIVLES